MVSHGPHHLWATHVVHQHKLRSLKPGVFSPLASLRPVKREFCDYMDDARPHYHVFLCPARETCEAGMSSTRPLLLLSNEYQIGRSRLRPNSKGARATFVMKYSPCYSRRKKGGTRKEGCRQLLPRSTCPLPCRMVGFAEFPALHILACHTQCSAWRPPLAAAVTRKRQDGLA